jgi:DNA-binding CsgD family transcriptional regulator
MARLQAQRSTYQAPFSAVVAAMDWLAAGFLIVRSSGQILVANEAAAAILAVEDGLVLEQGGVLDIARGFIAGVPSESPLAGTAAILAEARKRNGLLISVPRCEELLPLTVILRPSRLTISRSQDDAETFVVLIHDPNAGANTEPAGLRELYRLTITETRLAHLMMQGKTTDDCAKLLGVRQSTVKMHLRNLCGKLGVRRQSELVALLFKSFAGVRSFQPSRPISPELVSPMPDGRVHANGGRESAAC